jgi:hypothetical protein
MGSEANVTRRATPVGVDFAQGRVAGGDGHGREPTGFDILLAGATRD